MAARSNATPLPLRAEELAVMAGLVPAIHVFLAAKKAWMAATSAAMTIAGCEGARALQPFSRNRTAQRRARA
jgi:hypothetical protein